MGISEDEEIRCHHPPPHTSEPTLPHLGPTLPHSSSRGETGRVSPILTGKPGGRRRLMKSRSLAKSALLTAMRSMMGATCSHRDRGCSSHSHSLALNLPPRIPRSEGTV